MYQSSVKEERHDEAEIRELAAQMAATNKAKMLAATRAAQQRAAPAQAINILNFLNKTNNKDDKTAIDEESQKGRFGWTALGKAHIPYIFRGPDKYVAVRMVEMKVLNKYLSFLHQDIYNCTCIRSYYITEAESKLLNEINFMHCDSQFGRDQFTTRDLIVRLSDANEFYKFLDSCYTKLLNGTVTPNDRCGFIRINKESVVPYTLFENLKYVPLFYFEGETDNLKLKANKLEGWDLSYLKFCCKVQGIRNELFAHDSCSVISLEDIKNYFPSNTLFEDYWPTKMVDSQLIINGKSSTQVGQWTKQPPAPPAPPLNHPPPSPKPATQAKASPSVNNLQALYSAYPMAGAQPGYHGALPRATNSPMRAYTNHVQTQRQPRPYYTNMAAPQLVRATQG